MRKFAIIITTIFFNLFYRVEVINKEYIPKEGAAIFCSTHTTILDMFFLGYKIDRWIHWMAKEELFRNPISRIIYTSLGAFPVKRGRGDVGSIKVAYKHLQEGRIVGIFPQGTRVAKVKTAKVRVKSGAAMLAVNSGAQIIPALVVGSHRIFSRIRVVYGKPFTIPVKEDGSKYTAEELTQISNDIMDRVNSLEGVSIKGGQ